MDPDLEATAEAPRANAAVRVFQQRDNSVDNIEGEAVTSSQSLQSEGIRRRNTDQYAGAARESTTSSADTERTLTQERSRKSKDRLSHEKLMEDLKKDYICKYRDARLYIRVCELIMNRGGFRNWYSETCSFSRNPQRLRDLPCIP